MKKVKKFYFSCESPLKVIFTCNTIFINYVSKILYSCLEKVNLKLCFTCISMTSIGTDTKVVRVGSFCQDVNALSMVMNATVNPVRMQAAKKWRPGRRSLALPSNYKVKCYHTRISLLYCISRLNVVD